MDIEARIRRRQRRDSEPRLIQDYDSLSPISHVEDPADRGPILEQLLDHLDPVFDGSLPANAYIYGPDGAGKSAVVTALFSHLEKLPTEGRSIIHTTTRAQAPLSPSFVYVDTREASSEFSFYHAILDALVEENIPKHGVGTETLRSRLHEVLGSSQLGVVVAVDHVGEPRSASEDDLIDLFAGLPSNVSWLAIGRLDKYETSLTDYTDSAIRFKRYQQQMLVNVLMTRASIGLAQQALEHELADRIAKWAEGNAHDALAALFIATDRANEAGRTRLIEADVDAAFKEMPQPSVPLGAVFALPDNRQTVLRQLIDLGPEERSSVTATTEAIGGSTDVDLSAGTVKRFLYEMAEAGVVERVQTETRGGQGRPPSRVELRFPPTVFRRLYDLRE